MTDNVENLTLEILKSIQQDIVSLRNGQTDLKRELREGLAAVQVELSALGQQVGGFTTAFYSSIGRYNTLEQRVERIERRLELHDENSH